MMTKRDRVYAALSRNSFDAIPWQFDLTGALAHKLRAYYGTEDLHSATGDHVVWGGNTYCFEDHPDNPELVCNEFGSTWRRDARNTAYGDWGDLVSYPLKEPSLSGYTFPDPACYNRWNGVSAKREAFPDHFLLVPGFGLFESAWALCGFENYLAYLAGEPEFIEELTARLTDYACEVTSQLKGLGADGIRIGDDWGFQDRLMVRADVWRKLLKPHYRRLYQAAHDAGLVVTVHSCGNATEILPDLIEIGVQVFHPLQPEAMDAEFCKKEFGRDIAFWGGLGSQSTIPNGTPEQNRDEARRMLDLFSEGGYIMACAGSAPPETPVENIAAIVEVAMAQLSDDSRNGCMK